MGPQYGNGKRFFEAAKRPKNSAGGSGGAVSPPRGPGPEIFGNLPFLDAESY